MYREKFNDHWQVIEKGGTYGLPSDCPPVEVTLPYDAMIHKERSPEAGGSFRTGYYPNGTWEYSKRFYIPETSRGKKVWLQFDGVYQRSLIYINGDCAGGRTYGYSQFWIDAAPYLRYGEENQIQVIVHTADDARWYSGGGIYRDVWLLTAQRFYIAPQGICITTPAVSEDEASVRIETEIVNETDESLKTVIIEYEIWNSSEQLLVKDAQPFSLMSDTKDRACYTFYLQDPILWSDRSPYLYQCRVRVLDQEGQCLDEIWENFGIRSLALSPKKGLLVNGASVKLRGACIHHDNGPLGAVSTDFIEERRIRKLKEAGFNAIRSSHNPASPALLRACDKLGVYVMNEAFDAWTLNKTNFDYALEFDAHWEEDIESMIISSRNHPSVVLYSIGNEIADTGSPAGAIRGRQIAERVHELDSTRFSINSINGMVSVTEILNRMRMNSEEEAREGGDINQQMAGLGESMRQVMALDVVGQATAESYQCVDVAGYNYMDIRYVKDHENYPSRVICGTETFPPFIDQNWKLILQNPHVIGDFTWTGWDYIGEAGIGLNKYQPVPAWYGVSAPYPSLTAMSGDISISGYRRPISYYREIVFGLRKEPYIAVQRPEHYGDSPTVTPWSWSDSISSWSLNGFEDKNVKIEVYADADEIELRLNGEIIGIQKVERYMSVFETIYASGTLEAVAYKKGFVCGKYTLQSANGKEHICLRPEKEKIHLKKDELLFLPISIEDEAGQIYAYSNISITVCVEGPARLEAFGTDDPLAEENFYDSTRTTYDGRALAVIKPTGVGNVVITAESEHMSAQAVVEIMV